MKAIVVICHLNRTIKQPLAIQLAYECAAASTPLFKLRGNASRDQINDCKSDVNERISNILRGVHQNPKLPKRPLLTPAVVEETDSLLRGFWWRRTALVEILGLSGPHRRWGGGRSAILQPALFQWVQAMDRVLYLALNCVGGETYHAEAAGVIAQHQIESVYKRKTEAQISEFQRELANSQESHVFAARENNLSVEDVTTAEAEAHHQKLIQAIAEEIDRASREPALNMNGPLNWLEALITTDRNEAGLAFLYEEPEV
jgi:hypothetical protein